MKNLYSFLRYSVLLVALFWSAVSFSQDAAPGEALIIRGKIVDKKTQEPIQNVSVAEVDADNRTIRGISTDINGNFALKISNPKNKISISYIGYKTVTQAIRKQANLTIALDQENSQMTEVVVVSDRRTNNGNLNINDKNLTVASARIAAKELEEMGAASIDQALQGRLAGVDIAASSGDPGAAMSIRIRGTSSINAGTNPLIVVDGIPYETQVPPDFNFGTADEQGYAGLLNIAPSDIKEISVLKDAAATAMWGSRAANGVLIITTKRGSIGKPVLTYTLRLAMQKQPKNIPLLNGDQYSNLIPEMVMNQRGVPLNTTSGDAKAFAYDPSDPYFYHNYSQNTDWLAAITQIGFTNEHNLSITGGGERARYFASLGYLNQEGTTIGTSLQRITTRINLDYNVSERIKFKTDFAYTYSNNPKSYYPGSTRNEIRNVALNKMPNMSIYEYNEQGVMTPNYFSPDRNIQGQYPTTYNPVAMAHSATNRVITNRVTPHFNLQYDIIPRLLIATGDVQFDINNTKSESFLPQIATGRPTTETVVNRAYDGDNDGFSVQTKLNLVYTPKLATDHSLTSLISLQTYDSKSVSNQALTSNTASSLLQDPSIPSRTQNGDLNIGAGYTQSRSIGALINAQYGYKERYIINAGLRGDGNSKFGPSTRYGLFPSVSTRWRLSDEPFMRRFKFLNDLSVRASYGLAGNTPRYDYTFYNLYGTFAWNYLGQGAVYPSTIQLNNYKWEVIHGQNLGFNLIMLNRKINIDVDIYRNRTKDLLFDNLRIPTFTGYSAVDMNVGTMDNQGWEVNIMTTPYKSKDLTIDFNFNISHNENLIREISPFYANKSGDNTTNGSYTTFLLIDNPFGSIYGYRYKGVYKDKDATMAKDASGKPIVGPNGQNVAMRFNYPATDYLFQPGDAMYEDINHDGNIDYKDVVYLGNSNPKYVGGFGPTVTYKKLRIAAFFSFRSNYKVVNGTKMTTTNMYGFNNQSTAVLRRWRNPGDETDIPRAVWNAGYNWLGSDRYVEDASFLRFRTITARYTFDQKFVKKIKFKNLSAYLTAENMVTFTKYTGQDPEVSMRGSTGPFSVLTDNSTTPPTFMLTFGITGSF
jgi:TonB-linked SusC/RagA family outer membrane protein